MNAPERHAAEIYSAICNRIRLKRQANKFSLNELAKKTGFTKSYLSQIENMKREPSISTLTKIAFALEVDVSYLKTGENRNDEGGSITRLKNSERKVIPNPWGSSTSIYEPINDKKLDRAMDGYIVTVGPEFPPEPLTHEGQELAFVLEGSQEFVYDGRSFVLEKGDSFCFDSNKPHFARSLGSVPAKVLVVLTSKK